MIKSHIIETTNICSTLYKDELKVAPQIFGFTNAY